MNNRYKYLRPRGGEMARPSAPSPPGGGLCTRDRCVFITRYLLQTLTGLDLDAELLATDRPRIIPVTVQ